MATLREYEYGRPAVQWADFDAVQIRGRSLNHDPGASANFEGSSTFDPTVLDHVYNNSDAYARNLIEVTLDTVRAQLGHTSLILYADLAFYSYVAPGSGIISGTIDAYRLLASGADLSDCTNLKMDATGPEYWTYSDYAPYPGEDVAADAFGSIAFTGEGGVYPSSPDNFLDITDELALALRRSVALRLMLKGQAGWGSGYYQMAWNTAGYTPYLRAFHNYRLEFFQANASTGEIDLDGLVTDDEDTHVYLGALERGDTGTAKKLYLVNLGDATLPHVEILDDHPEWSDPVQKAGSGTGRLDYVTLAEASVSQEYWVRMTSSSAYEVKALAYRDNTDNLNPSYGGAGWTGTTAGSWTSPNGDLTIPAAAWQPGTLVNDEFQIYVKGNSTDSTWPADSNDQVQITYDSGGSADSANWRRVDGRRTRSTGSVTIDATTKKIPVRYIQTSFWVVGERAFIADDTNINHGDVKSVAAASVGSLSQDVGSGLDDCTLSGNYYGSEFYETADNTDVKLKITTAGATDEFQYSLDGGSTWNGSGIAMTGSAQQLGSTDLYVTWAATTGHTLNDEWTADVTPYYVELENLTANSNVYSADAKVGTSLPIRDLTAMVRATTTAAAGVSETPANRVYLEGPNGETPTALGISTSDVLQIVHPSAATVVEELTVQTVGGTYVDADADLTYDYASAARILKVGTGDTAFWARAVASGSTAEEQKELRLNTRV